MTMDSVLALDAGVYSSEYKSKDSDSSFHRPSNRGKGQNPMTLSHFHS